jgi:hypothetical protein
MQMLFQSLCSKAVCDMPEDLNFWTLDCYFFLSEEYSVIISQCQKAMEKDGAVAGGRRSGR